MAIITSVVIYPLLFIVPALLRLVIGDAPVWFASLPNVVVTIPLMTWILMPAVTKLLARWLRNETHQLNPPRSRSDGPNARFASPPGERTTSGCTVVVRGPVEETLTLDLSAGKQASPARPVVHGR